VLDTTGTYWTAERRRHRRHPRARRVVPRSADEPSSR
jgi:hypothetical protein